MRYNPGGYQGVPNQREFRAAATGRPLQWARSDRPAALAAYLNVAFRSMLTPAGWEVLYPARRAASTADPDDPPRSCSTNNLCRRSEPPKRGLTFRRSGIREVHQAVARYDRE